MAVMRGAVGFLAFFAAFSLKSDLFALGVAASMAVLGGFVGNIVGPAVRRALREEQMLAASLLVTGSIVLVGTCCRRTSRSRCRAWRLRSGPRRDGSRSTACSNATAPTRRGAGVRAVRDPVSGCLGHRRARRHHPAEREVRHAHPRDLAGRRRDLVRGRTASSTRAPDAHHVATTGRRPGAGSRDGRVPSTLE